MVWYFCGLRCSWPLQSFEQPSFVFVDHIFAGKMQLVAINDGADLPTVTL